MNTLQNTYLFQLYQHFRWLFWVVMLLIIGTAWFALHSREGFPFIMYGMYSLKETAQQEYSTYSIIIHGQELIYADYPDASREIITSTIQHYNSEKPEGLGERDFYSWLLFYIEDIVTPDGVSMKVYKNNCVYQADGAPQVISNQLLFNYHDH